MYKNVYVYVYVSLCKSMQLARYNTQVCVAYAIDDATVKSATHCNNTQSCTI